MKRKGILAVPGEYHYGEKTEKKTAQELKAAAERQPIVALTYGHPAGGIPRASDFIGTVSQKWNEEKQRVDGDFWFYDEIPEQIRDRIINEWPVAISAGFTVDDVKDSAQKGIFYTHVAVLRDTDDPKCPLNKCGVNVRMESSSPPDYRYEQAQSPAEPAPKKEPEKATVEEPEWAKELSRSIREMLARYPVSPAVQKPEEPKQPVPEPELQTPEAPKIATPTPRRVIPAGETKSPEEEMKVDPVSGMILLG